MFIQILKQINWVDILVVIILIRIGYVSRKTGFVKEFFKLLGTIFALYLGLHYYTKLSDFVGKKINIPAMPLEFFDFIFFVILVLIGYLIWVLLRESFTHFIKMEAVPTLSKWGGLILGLSRSILLSSLVIFMLAISSVNYFKESTINSYSGKKLFKVATQTYSIIWNGLMSKFMTQEKFNPTIYEIEESFR